MDYRFFNTRHVHSVAPYILGEGVWDAIKGHDFHTWDYFKEVLNGEYGITDEEARLEFFQNKPLAGEDIYHFIVRMERLRNARRYGEEKCFEVFSAYLSKEVKLELRRDCKISKIA